MSKSDVDMEDAKKLPSNSENKVQEFTSKVVDAKIENREKNSPSETVVQGEVNTSEGDGQDLDKSRNEDKKNTEVKTGVIDQSDPQIEANEPIEGDGHDLDKSRNEDKKNTEVKTEVIDQSDPQIDANEPIEGSDPAKIIIKSENGELINAHTEAEEQTASRNAFEKLSDPKGEVVDQNGTSGVEVENSTENGIEGGNYVESVEEMNNQDVAEDKLKEFGNEDANYVEPVVGGEKTLENSDAGNGAIVNRQLPTEITASEAPQRQNAELNEARHSEGAEREPAANLDRDRTVKHELEKQGKETDDVNCETDGNAYTIETAVKRDGKDSSLSNQPEAATPISHVRHYPSKAENYSAETIRNVFTQATLPLMGESDDGTPEDQTAFMKEIESFYRGRSMEFKPPKFYGQPLNCLKLWRAVIRLGGYDRVTGSKLWRQVGESFHPPKTCTTVSWTFRIFYEKSLLEYERHKTQTGELQLPAATLPEASGVDGEGNGYQGSGSGRARRDAAARAMQGWHTQQLFGNGEDKDLINTGKRDKNLKSIGSHKQKRPSEVEHSNKVARVESSKQLSLVVVTSVVDVGPPADWVKINVRRNKDCFEVYALVPGLLREEVRVQSDPAGRLVITGQPEQVDNPWGITPFKKVVSLPARIDPLQTSAVVSLHGRLFVRVPFAKTTDA